MAAFAQQSYRLYEYQPTLVGAGIFASIFCLLTALHIWQLIGNKTWHMIGFFIGGIFELIGYAARATSATQKEDQWTMEPYLIQSTFLLIAPSFFAASIYSVLGRIIASTDGDAYALIKKRWVTVFFVLADVFAFLMQAAGGGLMAMSTADPTRYKLGQHTIVGGLIIQLVVYFIFFVSAATFYQRMDSLPPVKRQKHARIDWQQHLVTLFVVSAFFMVRTIFRIVEYAKGHDGYLVSHEAFLYVFDALPMALIMAYMSWKYPVLERKRREGNSRFHLVRVSERGPSTREDESLSGETA